MLRNFWVLLFCVMCLGDPARAHPHVFVDARTGFIFADNGQLVALRISWTYDEFTTLVLFDTLNLDQDGDGQLNDADRAAIANAEEAAATRIFSLLPADQAADLRALWDEFEAAETADARFAKALDRFQPPNLNLASGGGSWDDYNVTHAVFEARMGPKIRHGAPALWDWLAPRVKAFFSRR